MSSLDSDLYPINIPDTILNVIGTGALLFYVVNRWIKLRLDFMENSALISYYLLATLSCIIVIATGLYFVFYPLIISGLVEMAGNVMLVIYFNNFRRYNLQYVI